MSNTETPSLSKAGKTKPSIPSGVMAVMFFIAAEAMLFAAFISAYLILRAGVPVWPPWGQPRLPIATTGFNSLVLLSSVYFLHRSKKVFNHSDDLAGAKKLYQLAIATGAFFVLFQGYEWVNLLSFGLTPTSSTYGGVFYLLIGAHAIHVVAGVMALVYVYTRLGKEKDVARDSFSAVQAMWYFVVGLWPVLYVTVYLM